MQGKKVAEYITQWLKNYAVNSNVKGFIIGISGGIDSAVTSTLCAKTGLTTFVLNMPIRQFSNEFNRSVEHINWLKTNFTNVCAETIELTPAFEVLEKTFNSQTSAHFLSMANTRARLRMLTLYAYAGANNLLVAGTGNKVEDFGVGFFTKYGDGGVDISPIADLYKTQVYEIGKQLGIIENILSAKPTDGLFADGRTDEDQIGASYPELEWAMEYVLSDKKTELTLRQKAVLEIYLQRHNANRHKMEAIPVCKIPKELMNF
ncbi:MAG: NAD(+) synthase [Bacteroidetes bacterium]|nr:NAD(+) synthase [Bacteroidota bacterium]